MKARKYNSPKLQELLDEITPEEMEETKQQMLKQIEMEQTEMQKLRSKILSSLANEPIDATEKELGYSAAMADIVKIIDEHTNRKVKQTALEWFENELYRKLLIVDLDIEFNQILEQAKQIEKEQIVEAFYQGVDQESDTHGAQNLDMKDAENYYNETFKTK